MQQLVQQKAKTDQPGFSVIVRIGKEIMLRGDYGLANMELAMPKRAERNLRLASQPKQFTVIAVLQS